MEQTLRYIKKTKKDEDYIRTIKVLLPLSSPSRPFPLLAARSRPSSSFRPPRTQRAPQKLSSDGGQLSAMKLIG